MLQRFFNGFAGNELFAHHAHGGIDRFADNAAAAARQQAGQQAGQAFLLRGFHQHAGQHQAPSRRIDKHQAALADMVFPVALIDFVADQQVARGFVRNAQQRFG